MAYETGTATDLADLLSKLSTFIQLHGWTEDELDDGVAVAGEGRAAFSKNSVFVSFKYDSAAPNHLSIHQALAYDGFGTDPGGHTDDSGNGYNSTSPYLNTNLDNERCVNDIDNGPFVSYHFFEQNSGPAYVHVVVETEVDVYRHFGFGELNKFNSTWTGGEYCYGHLHALGTGSTGLLTVNTVLLDGLFVVANTFALRAATMRAVGLPGQGGSEKWLQIAGHTSMGSSANWNDSAGETKRLCSGGFRSGIFATHLGNFIADPTTGFLPMYSLGLLYLDDVNSHVYYLGSMPDVRGITMQNLVGGQEITIGSDTWVVFPTGRRGTPNVNFRTYFQGVAYKKVTA